MINNVSWTIYWYTVATILLIYYALILVFGYSRSIKRFFGGKRWSMTSEHASLSTQRQNGIYQSPDSNENKEKYIDKYVKIQEVIDQLENTIQQAGRRQFPKEELMLAVKLHLQKLPNIREYAFRLAIIDFIIEAAENNCSIHLSESEVRGIMVR